MPASVCTCAGLGAALLLDPLIDSAAHLVQLVSTSAHLLLIMSRDRLPPKQQGKQPGNQRTRNLSDQRDDDAALTTPLAVTGTPKELDEQLPSQLVEFVETHLAGSNERKAVLASASKITVKIVGEA